MKVLFYPSFGHLTINDQPRPSPAADEVLLQVLACGICGSELESFRSQSPRRMPPLIMGHEFCGKVVAKGAEVSGIATGAYMVSDSVVSCGECGHCLAGETNLCVRRQVFGMQRNGAFAEFVNVPARCLIPFDEHIPPQQACLAEPLANGVHIVRLTRHIAAKRVLVIGAGPIGLMAQQAFQSLRNVESAVIDIKPERLKVAEKLGASFVMEATAPELEEGLLKFAGGEQIDIVIDAVGNNSTSRRALQLTRPGGALVMIGLHENNCSLQSYDIILPEKQVVGTYAATREDIIGALELIGTGKVDIASWIDYYSLDDGKEAFMQMLAGTHIKSVILPASKAGQ